MRQLNSDEAWRQIPVEEKLEIMAKAHAKGLYSAALLVVVGATCAAALQQVWLLWTSLLGAPLAFQFSSGKAWRDMKPALMLRYLAARSAARRYAYAARSKALNLTLLFRGFLEPDFSEQDIEGKLSAMADDVHQTEVWIALFEDTIVMMSEQRGGAALEFSHPVNSRLAITSNDDGGYSANKELRFVYKDRDDRQHRFKLTSSFPAALVVFERQYQALLQKSKSQLTSKVREMTSRTPRSRDEDADEDRLDNLSMLGED